MEAKKKFLRNKSLKRVVIVFVILLWVTLLVVLSNFFNDRLLAVYDNINFNIFLKKNNLIEESKEKDKNTEIILNVKMLDNKEDKSKIGIDNFIAYLEIPRLDLRKGLKPKESEDNVITKNIVIHESSKFPNIKNTNLTIVGQCGNKHNSYFRNLNKLIIDDKIYLYYGNMKYIYKLKNKYTEYDYEKVEIKKRNDVRTIALLTCDDGDIGVYIGELVNVGKYR